MPTTRKVRVLINPNSGIGTSVSRAQEALLTHWDVPGIDLTLQFSKSKEDGQKKTRQAIEDGVQTLLVAGGDGMINSIGTILIGSDVELGVIPTGSGNGFARHFDIPLDPAKAIASLATATAKKIDVGFANDMPFFVTCSLAWDAALVDAFEKSPVRGVLPYIFAGVYEFFGYQPQPFEFERNGSELFTIEDPQICTIANLTQYGGGAQIAPGAKADDGQLQLVTIQRRDFAKVLSMVGQIFDGRGHRIKEIKTVSFETLCVHRKEPGPMQLDGELLTAPADIHVRVMPAALNVLVP